MGYRVLEYWGKGKVNKKRGMNYKKDESFIQSVLLKELEGYKKEFLSNPDETDVRLWFEIRPEQISALTDLIANSSINQSLEFKQVKPTLYEIKNKNINVF